jgi:hypothetical protein
MVSMHLITLQADLRCICGNNAVICPSQDFAASLLMVDTFDRHTGYYYSTISSAVPQIVRAHDCELHARQ